MKLLVVLLSKFCSYKLLNLIIFIHFVYELWWWRICFIIFISSERFWEIIVSATQQQYVSPRQPHQKPHPYHSQFYSSNPGPGGLNKSTIIIVTIVNSPEYFCEFLGLEKHFSLKKNIQRIRRILPSSDAGRHPASYTMNVIFQLILIINLIRKQTIYTCMHTYIHMYVFMSVYKNHLNMYM